MKNALKPWFLMHIFMCAIALVFTANVNAKNSPLSSLEGDVIYIPAGSFFSEPIKKIRLEKLSLLDFPNRGTSTRDRNKIFFSSPSTLIAMR